MTEPRQPQDRQRPRKTSGSKRQRQAATDAAAVGLSIDGVEYVINPNDLTGWVEYEIRRECGMGVAEIVAAMERTQGIDYLGMFMWAVRRANGEDVALREVLEGISAGSDVEVMSKKELAAAAQSAPKA